MLIDNIAAKESIINTTDAGCFLPIPSMVHVFAPSLFRARL